MGTDVAESDCVCCDRHTSITETFNGFGIERRNGGCYSSFLRDFGDYGSSAVGNMVMYSKMMKKIAAFIR